jgi:NitT/TauT family transport system substrate-binding protein
MHGAASKFWAGSDLTGGRWLRSTRTWAVIGVVLFSACSSAPAGPAAKAKALEPVAYMLNFVFYGGHAPYFLALEKGYYADQGLEVQFTEGQGSVTTAKVVGVGSYPMGEVDGPVIIRSLAEDIPIKAVAGLIQKSPISVIVPRGSGISNPKGLVGKQLGGTPAGVGEVLLPTWLSMNGVNPDSVQLVSVGAEARNSTLIQGQVDGIVGFDTNVPIINAAGGDVIAIHYADFGLSLPSTSVIVNTTFLKEKPDVVRRFLAATIRGWAEARNDPKGAIDALLKHAPPTFKAEQETEALRLLIQLYHTKRTEGKPVGWMAADDWQDAINLLAEHADLKNKPRLEDAITNEFLPAS